MSDFSMDSGAKYRLPEQNRSDISSDSGTKYLVTAVTSISFAE